MKPNPRTENLRTIVSFRAAFGYESESSAAGAIPPGAGMADFLEAELQARGLLVDARRTTEDSHVFHMISGSRKFGLLLGLIEDDEREWLILSFSKLSKIRRKFGARDDDEYAAMLAAVDEVLRADERIDAVRWYSLTEWQDDPLEAWGDLPFETTFNNN